MEDQAEKAPYWHYPYWRAHFFQLVHLNHDKPPGMPAEAQELGVEKSVEWLVDSLRGYLVSEAEVEGCWD